MATFDLGAVEANEGLHWPNRSPSDVPHLVQEFYAKVLVIRQHQISDVASDLFSKLAVKLGSVDRDLGMSAWMILCDAR